MKVLNLRNVSVSFGGVRALDGVSLGFEERRLTALVGPNGAGKSTVFNVICGLVTPQEGQVYYKNRNLVGLPPWEITRCGIGRSFQDMLLFERMSVLENVLIVLQNARRESPPFGLMRQAFGGGARREPALTERALSLLKPVCLDAKAHQMAGSLSHGEQKLLSIARLLAADSEVLLLDEPVAWTHAEMADLIIRVIRDLVARGKTVVVIEHDLRLLREMTDDDRFYMLDAGRVVSQGSPRSLFGGGRARAAGGPAY